VKLTGAMHVVESIRVRVKWENGWLSDSRHDELELVKARKESVPNHTIPRRPKTIVESPRAKLERILGQRRSK
jgi:hypothetical protein